MELLSNNEKQFGITVGSVNKTSYKDVNNIYLNKGLHEALEMLHSKKKSMRMKKKENENENG